MIVKLLRLLFSSVLPATPAYAGGFLLLFFTFSSFLYPCLPANASDLIVVSVQLNTEEKGEYFVVIEDDGNFLVKAEDLAEIGLHDIDGEIISFQGDEYLSLKTLKKVSFELDEANLILQLDADPGLFPEQIVNMSPTRRETVYQPREKSIFFNYGIDYATAYGAYSNDSDFLTLTNELGVRYKDVLFLNDLVYTDTSGKDKFTRLQTSFTYDLREPMQRFIFGDFIASSGTLGGQTNMGGVSFSKVYRINPYFFENPLYDYSGFLTLPSDVDFYVDGVRLKTEHFSPGKFELRNFEGSGGGRDIEVVIRDSLGREQRIDSPFYFSDQLLREGLHEYSYNLGFLRKDFSQDSNNYSDLVTSAWHRYGYTDDVSIGGRLEAGNGLLSLGSEAFFLTNRYGVFRMNLSGSYKNDKSGWGSFLGYEYRSRRFSTRLFYQKFSDSYRNFNRVDADNLVKSTFSFGISYVDRKLGSLSFDFSNTSFSDEEDRTVYSASHSKQLNRRLYLTTTVRRINSEDSNTELLLNISYNFNADHNLSSRLYVSQDDSNQVIEAQKYVPAGVGLGWRAAVEAEQLDSTQNYALDTSAQQNGRYGIYRGELRLQTSNNVGHHEDVRLSTAGALTYVGGHIRPTRPVLDSFTLVKVSDLEDVRVYLNSQDMGRTDEHGVLVIPRVSSYFDNQISIEDKDIPIDYLMPQVSKNLSPPLRSGSCSYFPVEKYQAYMGQLVTRLNETTVPLEYYEATLVAEGRTVVFYSGTGGEFYFDNDPSASSEGLLSDSAEGCEAILSAQGFVFGAGVYHGQATTDDGQGCNFEVTIGASEDPYVELGEVFCQPDSSSATEEQHTTEELAGEEGGEEMDPNSPVTSDPLLDQSM